MKIIITITRDNRGENHSWNKSRSGNWFLSRSGGWNYSDSRNY